MLFPSASVDPLAVATMLSVVYGAFGVIVTVGGVGGVLTCSTNDVEAVRPVVSVAVIEILCTPAEKLD